MATQGSDYVHDVELRGLTVLSPPNSGPHGETMGALLRDVNLSVNRGDIVGVMGSSGSGKTSLFNALAGYYRLSSYDVQGYIAYRRELLTNVPRFGTVIVDELFPSGVTVKEFLTSVAQLSLVEWGPEKKKEHVDECIKTFGLADVRDSVIISAHGTSLLTLMQKRRLSLCCACMRCPNILILDEIGGGLQSQEALTLFNLIQDFIDSAESENTWRIVFCTLHQPPQEILVRCTKLVLLDAGRVMYCGPPQQLVPHLQQQYSVLRSVDWNTKNPADVALSVFQLIRYAERNLSVARCYLSHHDLHCIVQNGGERCEDTSLCHVAPTTHTTPLDSVCVGSAPEVPSHTEYSVMESLPTPLAPFFLQFRTLTERRWVAYKRNAALWWALVVIHIIQGVVLGVAFYNYGGIGGTIKPLNVTAEQNMTQHLFSQVDKITTHIDTLQNTTCAVSDALSPLGVTFDMTLRDINVTAAVHLLRNIFETHQDKRIPEFHPQNDNVTLMHILHTMAVGKYLANTSQSSTWLSVFHEDDSSGVLGNLWSNLGYTSKMSHAWMSLAQQKNYLFVEPAYASSAVKPTRRLLEDQVASLSPSTPTMGHAYKGVTLLFDTLSSYSKRVFPTNSAYLWLRHYVPLQDIPYVLGLARLMLAHSVKMFSNVFFSMLFFRGEKSTGPQTFHMDAIPQAVQQVKSHVESIYMSMSVATGLSNSLLLLTIFLGFSNFIAIVTFTDERVIFNRDVQTKLYSPLPYYLSRIAVELPVQTVPPLIMSACFYYFLGLSKLPGPDLSSWFTVIIRFVSFIVSCCSITTASYAFATMVSAVSVSLEMALSLMALILMAWLTTLGFLLRDVVLPNWVKLVQVTSLYRWGFFALVHSAFERISFVGTVPLSIATSITGAPNSSCWFSSSMTFFCSFMYFSLGYVFLKHCHRAIGILS